MVKNEPKSTGTRLILPADKVTQGDIPLGLMQTSLRSRLSRMPHGRHIKEEIKKYELETSLSTVADIKLGTRPSPPPRPMTYSSHEPTPTHTTHRTRNTREQSKVRVALCKRALSPARNVLEDTLHQARPNNDAGDAPLLRGSINKTRLD